MILKDLVAKGITKVTGPLWPPGFYVRVKRVNGEVWGELYTPDGVMMSGPDEVFKFKWDMIAEWKFFIPYKED